MPKIVPAAVARLLCIIDKPAMQEGRFLPLVVVKGIVKSQ